MIRHEEVHMEPVDPAPNPPEDRVVPIAPCVPVPPEDPVVRRSTRVSKPTTRYQQQSLIRRSGSLEKLGRRRWQEEIVNS